MTKFMLIVLYLLVTSVTQAQIISTIAGNGTFGYGGDSSLATLGQLWDPHDVAVDRVGNIYVADYFSNRIRKIDNQGLITTIAGDGTFGSSGDGGPAIAAKLYYPGSVAVDDTGNVYIADQGTSRIRKVSINGIITTVAGTGSAGYDQTQNIATLSMLAAPTGVALDSFNNIYITEEINNLVRKVTLDGQIQIIAGNRTRGYSGDNGLATMAQLNSPAAVTVDNIGNIYVADRGNYCIRKIDTNGIITTVAGNGVLGVASDGVQATSVSLTETTGVAVDNTGNLYISDNFTGRVRRVDTSGLINTIAGGGLDTENIGDGGPATSAYLNSPKGITFDAQGILYISDGHNNRIRKIAPLQQSHWTGSVDSNWENHLNWDNNKVPDSNSEVFIDGGTVVINSNTTIWSLNVSSSSNILIHSPYELRLLH